MMHMMHKAVSLSHYQCHINNCFLQNTKMVTLDIAKTELVSGHMDCCKAILYGFRDFVVLSAS